MGSLSLSGALPNPGLEPRSPILQADSSPVEPQGKPLLKILSEIGTDGVRLRVTKGLGAGDGGGGDEAGLDSSW